MNARHLGTNGHVPRARRWQGLGLSAVGLAAWLACSAAQAGFVSITIRGTPIIVENSPSPGATEFIIDNGGDKAALGSSDIDGRKLGEIATLGISRLDDYTDYTPGSGPYVAPYFNIWITDGFGNFAVVANEPSNPEWTSTYSGGYAITWDDLKTKTVKVFENSNLAWLPNAGVGLTFADLADFVIEAPSVGQLTAGWAGLGTGAPRELGTNVAYGVNWVFGDTLSNYVSGDPGYQVANAYVTAASAVPEPATLGLLAVAALGAVGARRRRA